MSGLLVIGSGRGVSVVTCDWELGRVSVVTCDWELGRVTGSLVIRSKDR